MLFDMGEKTLIKRSTIVCSWCAVWFFTASASFAQTAQTSGIRSPASHARVASNAAKPALTHSATVRKDLNGPSGKIAARLLTPADSVMQPATVSLRNGKLTIDANNSDLAQILEDLAGISGMTINGVSKGPRVFGVYGPGNSRDVLEALLVGAGYNFIMVGGAPDATPRELLFTAQRTRAPAITLRNARSTLSAESDEPEQPDSTMNPTVPNESGPGVISPVPSQNDQDDNTRVQQTLQRLQHVQEQQQNAPQ